jgi:hypothetical protein
MSDDTIYTNPYPPELTGKTFAWIYEFHPHFINWAAQPAATGMAD